MVLVLDNYDSFTYNLVQYLGELKADVLVHRNDEVTVEQIESENPERILVSPGPCTPREAGLSNDVIIHFGGKLPIMGVCLGHQCIGNAFGGDIVVNYRMMHGKTSPVLHNGEGLFKGLPLPLTATRYHSLIAERESLPDCLEVTAWLEDGSIMGLRHRTHPHLQGVQFHPESVLTEAGHQLLTNFLRLTEASEKHC